MNQSIVLRQEPKFEIQLLEEGFQIVDANKDENNGYFTYQELDSVEINRAWFPKLSVWMRVITTFLNGVPFFPSADQYKTANLILHVKQSKIGVWLTSSNMADEAIKLKELLSRKI